MGCCVSTPKKPRHSLVGIQKSRSEVVESRAPPPSMEEETVKEVLSVSETPRHKPVVPISKVDEEEEEEEEEKRTQKPEFAVTKQELLKMEEISEMSEICSLSESVSTTTITRDEEEEVARRVNRSPLKPRVRSFSGDLATKRERGVGKSPSRRSEQSPGRRNGNNVGSIRMVQSRESGQPMARSGFRPEQHRRDPGENSARRSRSPATRSGVGRSPSARRPARSPGRAATAPIDSHRRKAEDPTMEAKWPSPPNESLDNPLVSLECFIFL